jgi:D-arginine dehydrogenase
MDQSDRQGFDVIVVGAGMAGSAAAANLAAAGQRVLLLEQEERPGYHATGRSAALFTEAYGSAAVRALSRASRGFFVTPPPGFTDVPLVRPRGVLYVARQDQLEALERLASLPDVARLSKVVSVDDALTLNPLLRRDYLTGALFEMGAADIDVDALQQGYLRMLKAAGGRLLTQAKAVGMTRADGLWRVSTDAGDYSAPTVVNAAGAWADVVAGLAGVAPVGLQPLRRTAILVEPPAGFDIADTPVTIDVDEEFYFKPDAGLLLLSPADETPSEPCDAMPDEWDIAVAIDRVQAAAHLEVRRVSHKWAGLRSFVADRTPVAGFDPTAPGFYWLAGQGGYGICTAPALGRLAACQIVGLAIDGVDADHVDALAVNRKARGMIAA